MPAPDPVPPEQIDWARLTPSQRRAIGRILQRAHVARNTNLEFRESRTLGERAADRIAEFGGSWTFIGVAGAVLVGWIALNGWLLVGTREAFDPFPFILLNLLLSMLAALQAPIILMSQNRQAAKDRLDAQNDYEVNLKAELEIQGLHEKLDRLREGQWQELLTIQREQLTILAALVDPARAARLVTTSSPSPTAPAATAPPPDAA